MQGQDVYTAHIRAIEAVDLAALKLCYSDDCETASTGWVHKGIDAVMDGWRDWFKDFTDITLELHSLLICDAAVVGEWTESATQKRTGRSYRVRGASVARLRSAKIVSEYVYVDRQAIEQQLEKGG